MQTKDLIMYGAIVYLFLMLRKKQNCNCATMVPLNKINLPKFTTVDKQVQPTPAEVLSPEQLAVFNALPLKKATLVDFAPRDAFLPIPIIPFENCLNCNTTMVASIKGISKNYIC
jgi:hypothetical protein